VAKKLAILAIFRFFLGGRGGETPKNLLQLADELVKKYFERSLTLYFGNATALTIFMRIALRKINQLSVGFGFVAHT